MTLRPSMVVPPPSFTWPGNTELAVAGTRSSATAAVLLFSADLSFPTYGFDLRAA